MKEHERKGLLERIERDGATVGTTIPEELEIDGEPVALRDLVFELRARDDPVEPDRLAVAKKRLRRERRERYHRIEDGELAYEAADREVEAVIGLDRALSVLEDRDDRGLEDRMDAESVADTRRWMDFLEQVLGRDDDARRTRS